LQRGKRAFPVIALAATVFVVDPGGTIQNRYALVFGLKRWPISDLSTVPASPRRRL
jgi:hypothetical protein